jgi:K+-sensing histidine kinase KdpD
MNLPFAGTRSGPSGYPFVRQLFEAGGDIPLILQTLACYLTSSYCDGCAIVFSRGDVALSPLTYHRVDPGLLAACAAIPERDMYMFDTPAQALEALPAYAAYIRHFGLRTLAVLPMPVGGELRASVIVTRDRSTHVFEAADLVAMTTCIAYASLAAESAIRLEVERSQVRAERERTTQFRHEILGVVGHDLRGPLGAILIAMEMLAVENTGDTMAVRRVISFAKRMTRIVERVLDLTRLRLGNGIPLALSPARLLPLLESTIAALAAAHPASSFELCGTTDARGTWDTERLAQVLECILTNAAQHGRESGKIRIDVAQSDHATTVTVHNELRDGASLATDPFGPGINLQIANAIMRGHGGTITTECSDSGTNVEIALPVLRAS